MLVGVLLRVRLRAGGASSRRPREAPLHYRHVSAGQGWMMQAPGPNEAPIAHLEHRLWVLMGARSRAVGEPRFRRLVRLTVRHWPSETLERIRRAGHWQGVERKRVGRILLARVREAYEASDGVTDAWPIILEGTVGLMWVAICDLHLHDAGFRATIPDLSRWIARHGIG